uniref:Uncharacterized protein n=1 Tax=Anguilla anguilla TaxID=7936 RepID=A0A0E9W6Z3_ANGAN
MLYIRFSGFVSISNIERLILQLCN